MNGNLLIKNGRVIDPSQRLDQTTDVLILNGKVEKIQPGQSAPREDVEVLDAKGLIVTPGWVDMHTHLREPGGSHKETIKTGTEAAAVGGFTTIACMANTNPVNDNSFITSFLNQRFQKESLINVHCIGAITKGLQGEELAEFGLMREAGAVGVSDDGMTVMNAYLMRKALDYSKRFELPVIVHAEDCNLKGKGVMNEGFNSARFGLRGIPRASEELIVARDILLAELTGARLHIAHVSTRGSVALIRDAKKRGLARISAEVTPHHLTLTDEVVGSYDTNTKVAPPLRELQDVEAVQEGLADGTLDALATDHAPHSVEEKQVEYDMAAFGMVGLETAFPLYHRLVLTGKVRLERVIEAMTIRPAEILGVSRGTLKVGSVADVTLFDPKEKYKIDKTTFKSKSQNTPFHGWEVTGRVKATIVAGNIVFRGENP